MRLAGIKGWLRRRCFGIVEAMNQEWQLAGKIPQGILSPIKIKTNSASILYILLEKL
jgi:hypothetical protein